MSTEPPQSTQISKLQLRRELLAVVDALAVGEDVLPREERLKHIKHLRGHDQDTIFSELLLKELGRLSKADLEASDASAAGLAQASTKAHGRLQVLGELLMEFGSLDRLQDPLWQLIKQTTVPDSVKDMANLILRQLGDSQDPELYLNYLNDPDALITRETQRMLEVSNHNPEALVDFLDFITSLPDLEQSELVDSLLEDYDPETLPQLLTALLLSLPPQRVRLSALRALGSIRKVSVAQFLENYVSTLPDDAEEEHKVAKRSMSALRLAGLYRPEVQAGVERQPHSLTQQSKLLDCHLSFPDGLGNQGLLVLRQHSNGDYLLWCVALNDQLGIIDSFGFYALSEHEVAKIRKRFQEHSSKVVVTPTFCRSYLDYLEQKNKHTQLRLPYEYSCWSVLLDDITVDTTVLTETHSADSALREQTVQLFDHPDFKLWFLEAEDETLTTEVFDRFESNLTSVINNDHALETWLQPYEEQLVTALKQSQLLSDLVSRLRHCVCLFEAQGTDTLATLAATEASEIEERLAAPHFEPTTFITHYVKRCLFELASRLSADELTEFQATRRRELLSLLSPS